MAYKMKASKEAKRYHSCDGKTRNAKNWPKKKKNPTRHHTNKNNSGKQVQEIHVQEGHVNNTIMRECYATSTDGSGFFTIVTWASYFFHLNHLCPRK